MTTVSYYVAPTFRNQGYGTKLARYITDRHEKASFVVKKENAASVKVALAALRGKFAATMGRHVVRLTKEAAQFINPFPGNLPDRKITVRELQRSIRQAIAAEEEAVHFYEAIVDATDHPLAKKVFQKIADEEQVHSGEFNHLLSKLDTDKDSLDEKGEKEVDNMSSEKRGASMDEKTAIELLKWSAGPKTYPISRFMTSPLAMALISGPLAPLGWGVTRFAREIQARALLSRAMRGGNLMKTEKATVEALRAAKIKKAAGISATAARQMHPLAEFLTSRVFQGVYQGGQSVIGAAVTGNPVEAALVPVSAAVGVGGAVLGRTIHARALRGRLALGGKGLIGKEREAVELLRQQARKSLAKRVAIGAGAAAAVGGAAYGAKKLVEADATA